VSWFDFKSDRLLMVTRSGGSGTNSQVLMASRIHTLPKWLLSIGQLDHTTTLVDMREVKMAQQVIWWVLLSNPLTRI
jgi:hypothetical protein